jgi:hypothetical protein
MGWLTRVGASFRIELVGFDARGEIVGRQLVDFVLGFRTTALAARGPMRRVEARLLGSLTSQQKADTIFVPPGQTLGFGIVRAQYVGLRDYLDSQLRREACTRDDDFSQAYEGRGKLFFLPNHEYEIAVTTRVSIAHPSTSTESAAVEEFVYFKTKGLPGLNAVQRVGAEIEPYVNSAYTGGKGILYREEPVTLAFKEDFHVAVPLALRPPGTAEERTTLLRMKLLVQPNTAATQQTPFTSTSADWIVAHRVTPIIDVLGPWMTLLSASETRASTFTSDNPFRIRLAQLTQRESSCELNDPRNVIGSVLVAPPQGTTEASQPGQQFWPGRTSFNAAVRLEGAGFIDRREFVSSDATAFQFALDAGAGDSAAWSVVDGRLNVAAGTVRRFAVFGEPTWNHLAISVSFLTTDSTVGIGLALPVGAAPAQGLFAVVERVSGERRLSIYRRNSGVQFVNLKHEVLAEPPASDAPVTLIVTAFDDIMRASVGEVSVEVERDELREGRLSLFALGDAQFTSLQVTGLDLYTFPLKTSRFISFADHINIFLGTLDVISPNSLGPGTTTSTTATLWSATHTEIAVAMQEETEPAVRQTLFDRWVRELGLPLKDELTQLEISRFGTASTELLLIESPEPLDFTEEIVLALSQRVVVSDVFDTFSGSTTLAERLKSGSEPGPVPAQTVRERRRVESLSDLRKAIGLASESTTEEVKTKSGLEEQFVISDLVHSGDALRVEFDPATIPARTRGSEEMVFAEVVELKEERRLRLFAGVVDRSGRRAVVQATQRDELILTPGKGSTVVSESIAQLEKGRIAVVDASLTNILGLFRSHFAFEAVNVRVLQDGTGQRAIVIPISSPTTSRNLTAGVYRLKFTLLRHRWKTNDPADSLNQYLSEATLVLTV